MRFARRSFVLLALGLALWTRGAAAAVIGGQRQRVYPLTALAPFLDVLIPRDETGSATDFNVDRRLLSEAQSDPAHVQLLRAGCQWLDSEARGRGASGFAELDPAGQDVIVARLARMREGSPQRVFFETVRRDAFRAYYADPASWKPLGYTGPPQPAGYMDRNEAPR